ncbi:hypothetical protein [uncultured Mycolicibacterium sp.]
MTDADADQKASIIKTVRQLGYKQFLLLRDGAGGDREGRIAGTFDWALV